MTLRARKPYLTCMVALCATTGLTLLLLFMGIAAACEGTPGKCEKKPSATNGSATAITHESARIDGQVNPNGCVTNWIFEFRKAGGAWGTTGFGGSGLEGELSQSVEEWMPFLEPKTTYEFRLTASNEAGKTTASGATSFTTSATPPPPKAPTVKTEAATLVTGTSARLNGFVEQNGAATHYRFEYGTAPKSFTKTTSYVNVKLAGEKVTAEISGLAPGTTYYYRIFATNSSGSTPGNEVNFTTTPWKIKESPNPAGASDSNLYDVSCEPSTSVCTSVGKSTNSGNDSPVAQRWNGTSWSEQTAAKKSGATHTRLFGVDCPSETRCLAVGNHQSSEGASVLSEIWNEGKWTVQTTPLPTEATESEFSAIGCNNTAECTAVGSALIGGVETAIAERWKSPTWSLSSLPIPKGAKASRLNGVDCLWSNFCVAVGSYIPEGKFLPESLVMFWNAEWTVQSVPKPHEKANESTLLGVSCTPTPNRCTAVGTWKILTIPFTLAYRFNGTSTWTLQSTPNVSETSGASNALQDVSCATETSCTAVGDWKVSGGSTQTLAEKWDGTSWSIQGTPNPVGASFSSLLGVSCLESSCMGVGWSTSGTTDTTLSEIRE